MKRIVILLILVLIGVVASAKQYVQYFRYNFSFRVAKYALTDVIEAIENDGGKDIIITKEDDNLIVKYKPNWIK